MWHRSDPRVEHPTFTAFSHRHGAARLATDGKTLWLRASGDKNPRRTRIRLIAADPIRVRLASVTARELAPSRRRSRRNAFAVSLANRAKHCPQGCFSFALLQSQHDGLLCRIGDRGREGGEAMATMLNPMPPDFWDKWHGEQQ